MSILADPKRRQDNLWAQLEAFEPSGDPDIDREYRSDLQHRFAKLAKERRDVQTQLGRLGTDDRSAANDPSLLELIPEMSLKLAELPVDIQRRLYEAFQLQVRYNQPKHEAVLRVTISREYDPHHDRRNADQTTCAGL